MTPAQLARRFGRIYTAAITDVMDEMGYLTQTLPHSIRPLAVEWGRPIVVGSGRPAVRVAPGDVVVADLDGVAVVPRRIAAEVLRRSQRLVGTEGKVRRAVKQGMLPLTAYERYGAF